MNQRRVIATVDWPWAKDKRSEEEKPKAKSSIAESMKMRSRQYGNGKASVPVKRLKPISNIIRKPNGSINKSAVKNLIHSLNHILETGK